MKVNSQGSEIEIDQTISEIRIFPQQIFQIEKTKLMFAFRTEVSCFAGTVDKTIIVSYIFLIIYSNVLEL